MTLLADSVRPTAREYGDAADVTVVMVTRNRRRQLLATLDRLRADSGAAALIVVDNGSTDGSADAVNATFPDVQVIRSDRNLGAVGRTVGVEAARTAYVAFADDDSWWAPGALATAERCLQAAPRLGLLAARLLVGPQERLDPACVAMASSPLPPRTDLPGPTVLGFVACGSVVRRSAYLQVGGFHRLLFFLGEESLLAQDLAAAGWGVAYVDKVVAHHHPGANSDRDGRKQLEVRNALLAALLRRPAPMVARLLLALLPRLASEPQVRGGVTDALRRLPSALAQRHPLPAHVEREVRLLEAAGA
ncbi:MAG: glycosyltransferase family 2 protein [Mycobacteriales bacterium]